jgi:uncharacterized membrane protein
MNRLGPRTRLLIDSAMAVVGLLTLIGVVFVELAKGLVEGNQCKEKSV